MQACSLQVTVPCSDQLHRIMLLRNSGAWGGVWPHTPLEQHSRRCLIQNLLLKQQEHYY